MSIPLIEQEIFQVIMRGVLTATGATPKVINNVFHFRRTLWATPYTKAAINTAFQSAIGDTLLLALSSAYTQTANLIRCINDAEDAEESFTQAGVGGVSGDRLPGQASVVMHLRSATRGKFAQGKKYFRGIAESSTTMDLLNAGAITLFGNVGTIIVTGFTAADGNVYVPCVVSYSQSTLSPNPTTVKTYDINRYILNKNIGKYKKSQQATVR